jgi:hypothetical protein
MPSERTPERQRDALGALWVRTLRTCTLLACTLLAANAFVLSQTAAAEENPIDPDSIDPDAIDSDPIEWDVIVWDPTEWESEFSFEINGGYRGDDIKVKSTNCFCDSLKLKWKNSDLNLFGVEFAGVVAEYFYFRAKGDWGFYQDANFRLKQTGDDDSGPNPFTVKGDANGESVWAALAGVGFQIPLFEKKLRISPLGGYSYDEQHIQTKNTRLVLFDDFETNDVFPRVKYDLEWKGPWAGFDLSYQVTEEFLMTGTFEYHWADFDGKLKLRNQDLEVPNSIGRQSGNADGIVWSLVGQYRFYDWLTLRLRLRLQEWDVNTHTDLGKEEVKWTAVRFTLGFVIPF